MFIPFCLRVLIGAIFIYHGVPKGIFWETGMTTFEGLGLPGFLGPTIGILEIACGVALIIGLWTNLVSILISLIMLGAITTVQLPNAVNMGAFTCGLERDLLIFFAALCFPLYGPGSFALDSKRN